MEHHLGIIRVGNRNPETQGGSLHLSMPVTGNRLAIPTKKKVNKKRQTKQTTLYEKAQQLTMQTTLLELACCTS